MSARRAARARGSALTVSTASADVLALLRRPDAPVWRDHGAWLDLMAAHGWDPSVLACFVDTHPYNRRAETAEAWAVENGVTLDGGLLADRNQLRRLGLAYDG